MPALLQLVCEKSFLLETLKKSVLNRKKAGTFEEAEALKNLAIRKKQKNSLQIAKNKNTQTVKIKKIICKNIFNPRLRSGIEIASYSNKE